MAESLSQNPKQRIGQISQNRHDPFINFDPMGKHYYSDKRTYSFTPDDESDSHMIAGEERKFDKRRPKLYVTHFREHVDEDGLRKIFSIYGEVLNLFIRKTENGERFAFVNYGHTDHALAAIHGLHLRSPYRLRVKFAKEKKNPEDVALDPIVDPSVDPVVPIIPEIEYLEPKFPLILSNARENLKNSHFVKQMKGSPKDCYNRFITKVARDQRQYVQNKIFLKNKLVIEMSGDESED